MVAILISGSLSMFGVQDLRFFNIDFTGLVYPGTRLKSSVLEERPPFAGTQRLNVKVGCESIGDILSGSPPSFCRFPRNQLFIAIILLVE
jgi:hypothetical protein